MDEILRKMRAVNWIYADKDPNALSLLEQRIADTGQRLGLITYSKLVSGITFHLPNIKNGQAYYIRTFDPDGWSGLDREIIGEFLGYISTRSYEQAGFMASALVVNNQEYKPSWHFFEWMETLNVLTDMGDEMEVLSFWAEQVNRAHNWYKSQRSL